MRHSAPPTLSFVYECCVEGHDETPSWVIRTAILAALLLLMSATYIRGALNSRTGSLQEASIVTSEKEVAPLVLGAPPGAERG